MNHTHCEHCGTPLSSRQIGWGQRFCCRNCYDSALGRTKRGVRKAQSVCKRCHQSFMPKRGPNATFCSRECAFAYRRENPKPKAIKQPKPIPTQICKLCSKPFQRYHPGYCSGECRKIAATQQSIESYLRRYPERREARPCQECGTIASDAPELDHIVPLALGGTHTWDNVQCLCRQCNIDKGATVSGQLRLA